MSLKDDVKVIARAMITCSHENMLDDEEFDKYIYEIISKVKRSVKDTLKESAINFINKL